MSTQAVFIDKNNRQVAHMYEVLIDENEKNTSAKKPVQVQRLQIYVTKFLPCPVECVMKSFNQ